MFEKVNPCHPDKVADRIAGAIVDLAYRASSNPHIAVEVLLGHGVCVIITETDVRLNKLHIHRAARRIAGSGVRVQWINVPQDKHLNHNQSEQVRCGDNGIFKGTPETMEQAKMTRIARSIYERYHTDGKYIIDGERLIICQSNAKEQDLRVQYPKAIINPLGFWTGGTDVDTGATNRKLGSDMADGVTGGGLHGKDLSKADVSVNVWCFLEAQRTGKPVTACCAIGDTEVNGVPYSEIVKVAREYIKSIGGFEKFAEWGLVR